MDDHDSPWKQALQHFLEPFLALFFPQIHADIDWTRGYEWLDHELRKIKPKDKVGRRDADALVKVWHKDGGERWLLIHIEVQARRESGFPRRMFVYHYRILNQKKMRCAAWRFSPTKAGSGSRTCIKAICGVATFASSSPSSS